MAVTELGCMTVKPDHAVMDESTPEGKILAAAWGAVTNEPTGPYRCYYGLEVENPSKIWGFFDFDSMEDHANFARTFGGEAVKDLPTILADSEFTKHAQLAPFPPAALLAPVTEVLLAYFPADTTPEQKSAASARLGEFAEKALKTCADVRGWSFGWGVEDDFPIRGDEKKGCLLMALVGWTSIEDHAKFGETDACKENMALLGMEGMMHLATFHVKCRSLQNHKRTA